MKVTPDGPGDDGSGMWSTDSDSEREQPPHRVSKVARKPAASRVKKTIVIEESGSEAGPAPVRKPTSRVMYRTELYRVKKDMDGNLISDYAKATRHEQPPKLKLTSAPTAEPAPDPVDGNLPIFEVTTFLAAPPALDFKKWQLEAMAQGSAPWPEYDSYGVPPAIRTPRVGGYHPPASELARRRPRFDVESLTPDENDETRDDESVIDPDKPIEIEGEAGTILEIHSPLIIDAIQKVGPGYPGLAVEGSSLTVTEPFCALMHYRDQMKAYYEASQGESEPQSSKSTSHLDSKGALVKSESRAFDNLPLETRQDGVTHVDELYQFLDHLYLKSVASERVRWAQEVPTCTFEWVWLLFPPQTLIYEPKSFDEPVSRAFRVKTFKLQGLFDESRRSHSPSVNPHRLKSRQDPHFKNHLEKVIIVASYLKHDGRKWTTQNKEFKIVPYKGEKKITDLPAYPARYLKDPDSTTRSRLIERGKRYHSLASRGQFEYHGETLSGSRRRLDGRIMVDSETYHYDRALTRNTRNRDISPYRRSRELEVVREPNSDSDARSYVSISDTGSESDDGPFNVVKEIQSRSRRRAVRRSGRARPQIQAQLDAARKGEEEADELFMICHSELRAYVLKERDWVRLSVDSISPCSFDQQMIDDLQISPGAKRMIQAFSQGYSMSLGSALERRPTLTAEAWSADFVPGKGRGQIMLLHGRPGTGKTSTAECIAELTKRPLLTVTCGDLGTNSYHVEQELTRWLRLGALWNAVLLFDEADVFLESREHGDIERNGLVSVFLRALEYYQGLMFLTTNRIGTFDEAILSRVHVILHFPDLTDIERAKIWDTSFRKLADERPNIKIDFSLFDLAYRDEKIKGLKWNGREIRNAFNTMIALAEFDAHANGKVSKDGKVEVRREHLQEVADMSGGFKRYMRSLRGLDSAGYAKGLGLRDDEFDSKGDGEGKRE
jgi:ATPase family associated with various cellular activities (AAA)